MTRADPENLTFTFPMYGTAGQHTAPDNLFINENDTNRTAEGGQTPGTGNYQDANVYKNANAYLRPYSEMSGAAATPSMKAWID
jgi:hypothetical protein